MPRSCIRRGSARHSCQHCGCSAAACHSGQLSSCCCRSCKRSTHTYHTYHTDTHHIAALAVALQSWGPELQHWAQWLQPSQPQSQQLHVPHLHIHQLHATWLHAAKSAATAVVTDASPAGCSRRSRDRGGHTCHTCHAPAHTIAAHRRPHTPPDRGRTRRDCALRG
jgi:hypothetical protein